MFFLDLVHCDEFFNPDFGFGISSNMRFEILRKILLSALFSRLLRVTNFFFVLFGVSLQDFEFSGKISHFESSKFLKDAKSCVESESEIRNEFSALNSRFSAIFRFSKKIRQIFFSKRAEKQPKTQNRFQIRILRTILPQ